MSGIRSIRLAVLIGLAGSVVGPGGVALAATSVDEYHVYGEGSAGQVDHFDLDVRMPEGGPPVGSGSVTFNHKTYPFSSPDCMRVDGYRAVMFWDDDPDGSGPFTAGRITVTDGRGSVSDTFFAYGYPGDRCGSLEDMGPGGSVVGNVVVDNPFYTGPPPVTPTPSPPTTGVGSPGPRGWVGMSSRVRYSRFGTILVPFTCRSRKHACRGTARFKTADGRASYQAPFLLAPGKTDAVAIGFTRPQLRELRRRKTENAKITARSRAGSLAAIPVRLRAPRPRR